MIILHKTVGNFFDELLYDIDCQKDTRAYIISIYEKYKTADCDLSNYSVGEMFCQARQRQNFATYQDLADWLFVSQSIFPQHLHHASKDYYDNIAQMSYYSCYNLINRQWKLYQELADSLISLEEQVQVRLAKLNTQTLKDNYIVPFDL